MVLGFFTGQKPTETSTSQKKIQELSEAWTSAQTKTMAKLQKYKELLEFTKALSVSYEKGMTVIIDISGLLEQYNTLLDNIVTGLKELENTMETGEIAKNMDNLRTETQQKITSINDMFAKNLDAINKAISSATSNTKAIGNINEVKNSLEDLTKNKGSLDLTPPKIGGNKRNSKQQKHI
jgi:hypothetical protein